MSDRYYAVCRTCCDDPSGKLVGNLFFCMGVGGEGGAGCMLAGGLEITKPTFCCTTKTAVAVVAPLFSWRKNKNEGAAVVCAHILPQILALATVARLRLCCRRQTVWRRLEYRAAW